MLHKRSLEVADNTVAPVTPHEPDILCMYHYKQVQLSVLGVI